MMPTSLGDSLFYSPARSTPVIGVMTGAHYRRLLIFFMLSPLAHEARGGPERPNRTAEPIVRTNVR